MKSTIDYANLSNKVYKKAYKLSEVNDKIVKVAFSFLIDCALVEFTVKQIPAKKTIDLKIVFMFLFFR